MRGGLFSEALVLRRSSRDVIAWSEPAVGRDRRRNRTLGTTHEARHRITSFQMLNAPVSLRARLGLSMADFWTRGTEVPGIWPSVPDVGMGGQRPGSRSAGGRYLAAELGRGLLDRLARQALVEVQGQRQEDLVRTEECMLRISSTVLTRRSRSRTACTTPSTRRRGALPGQQAAGFVGQEQGGDEQQCADCQGSDAVENGPVEPDGQPKADRGNHEADQRCQNPRAGRRIFRFLLARMAARNGSPTWPARNSRQAMRNDRPSNTTAAASTTKVHPGVMDWLGPGELRPALIDGRPLHPT